MTSPEHRPREPRHHASPPAVAPSAPAGARTAGARHPGGNRTGLHWRTVLTWLAALAAALALGAAVTAAPSAAAPSDPWLDLAGLQTLLNGSPSGVDGTFRTVVGGGAAGSQDPVIIPMKVLAIVGKAGPDGALILFRADMTDPVMARIGNIAAGMSGSPLYVTDGGTPKVIGALSYGDAFTTGGLGLATPIQYMIDIETRYPVTAAVGAATRHTSTAAALGTTDDYRSATLPNGPSVAGTSVRQIVVARDAAAAHAAPRSAGTAVFAPLAAVQIGGLPYDSAAYKKLANELTARGHIVLRGLGTGPSGWDPDYQTTLVPGAACAAMYTRGEMWAGAIGTVTYVNGSVLLAFGHPFDWSGPSGLYLDNAWIDGIWSSAMASYKLGEPGMARGTVTQDRGSGIGARLDQTPAEVPVTSSATVQSGSVTRTATSATWMARYVADQSLGAFVAQSAVSVPIYRAGDTTMMAGGATTTTTIKVSDGTTQHTVTRANIWDNPADVIYDATVDVADILFTLTENAEGVAPATVVSVDYQAAVGPQRRLATIVGVTVPGGLHAGDNTVNVTLAPYGSNDDVVVPVTLTLPEGTSTEGSIIVSSVRESGGDMPAGLSSARAAVSGIPAAPGAEAAGTVAPRASRTTLAQLVADLNAAPNNADVKVAYQTSAPQPVVAYGRSSYYVSGSVSASTTTMQVMFSPQIADYGARTVTLAGIIGSVAESGTVAVYKRTSAASTWTLVNGSVTVEPQSDGTGTFLLAFTGPKNSTTYRAVWDGDSRTLGASAEAKLQVRARVTLAGRALSSGALKFTAKVAPNQTGKMVAIEKKSGKKWVRLALVKLKSGSTAKWTWYPAAGTYHVRAHFLGASSSAADTSPSLKVIVR